ncbi:TonB-dependent receptor domain-containing protein [Massilia phyllosphaerae]|uniref:TonB-dependent receptor domain-containing protein n=1 Tax=Massilia phyllosphaerae TaxID=3106034 RepID=UPI002B1CDD5D|nr:TonB-dependent receptor [Massilia sp. SGZ-792]
MFKEKVMARSVRVLFAGGLVAGLSGPALGQEATRDGNMQRVEITGSSIKRINVEGALPVQTLSKQQIEQTGATTVADLVGTLPSMQGMVTSSASINGGGGGVQTASVHAIGSDYTLVLLNGRRVAPFGAGSAVNLASIPLSAVERVEILTDGASALYGSDAIAGVVNFILKKNQQDLQAEATYNTPTASSKGRTANVSVSKGFGDLDTDGYNVLVAFNHDGQRELDAADRSFSAPGGVHQFTNNGKLYSLYQTSANSIPANVRVTQAGKDSVSFNPAYVLSGKCPVPAPYTFNTGNTCRFNYAATVEDLPKLERNGVFSSGSVKLGESHNFFYEGLYSKFTSTARYAAPAQPLTVDRNSLPYKTSVVPALVKLGIDPAQVTGATMSLRLVDAGGRMDAWETLAKHGVVGVEGVVSGWDYKLSYTNSENVSTERAIAGYTSSDKLDALIKAGTYNPFVAPDSTTRAALAPAVLHQDITESLSKIQVASARLGCPDLFQLAGGNAGLGAGIDFMQQEYAANPSPIQQGPNKLQPNWTDTVIGGGAGALPFDTKRNSWGSFVELALPVTKTLDISTSVRYDSYGAAKNSKNYDTEGNPIAPATQGNKASSATYKLGAAWRPIESLLVRASYGTGFKAPTLDAITTPVTNGGSSNFYACPVKSGPLLPLCTGPAEYSLLVGGNPLSGPDGLRPEKSKQFTAGIRLEPMSNLSLGVDFWDIKLKDQIQSLPQDLVFTKPESYGGLFQSYYDPIQKANVLAAFLPNFNIASSHYRGIDWDHTYSTNTRFGKVNLNWTGTYMLKAQQDVPGAGVESSVGRFDSYNEVTFRLIQRLTATWKQNANFTHALTFSYRSGYHDQALSADLGNARLVNADGTLGAAVDSVRDVKSYSTFDWQTKYKWNANLSVTLGIKNLLNQDPPFTQRIDGGGNQLGYDGRYADPLGRQIYVVSNVKF